MTCLKKHIIFCCAKFKSLITIYFIAWCIVETKLTPLSFGGSHAFCCSTVLPVFSILEYHIKSSCSWSSGIFDLRLNLISFALLQLAGEIIHSAGSKIFTIIDMQHMVCSIAVICCYLDFTILKSRPIFCTIFKITIFYKINGLHLHFARFGICI